MSGIAGFYDSEKLFTEEEHHYRQRLQDMAQALLRRGPDEKGMYLAEHTGIAMAGALAADSVVPGSFRPNRPFQRAVAGKTFAIACDCAVYNTEELKSDLEDRGWDFDTGECDEVLLTAYLEYGPEFVSMINGVFALAIHDPVKERLFLCRDRSGIKPLFYMFLGTTLLFASEIKGILAWPEVPRQVDQKGLNEIFSLGPARSPGCGIYRGIKELLPAHYLIERPEGPSFERYWQLQSHIHEDSYDNTLEKTSFLIQDAVKRQMKSDAPICTFLSGGVDSSIVSAIAAAQLAKQGKQLNTFSFDFTDNDKNFKANAFQPSLDRPYVDKMVEFLGSSHHYLECGSVTQADRLYDSVTAHDLPAMGDVDSSMLHFCSLVSGSCKVALTGECADEIFGGYPWFHKKECLDASTFPWTMDLNPRKILLKDDFIDSLDMDEYVANAYKTSVSETPRLAEDTPEEARRREIAFLNLRWFMQTLINRMDRDSMYSGLDARVPFADHRIIEYIWNVPWDMKASDGMVKHLLRQSSKGLLPDEILFRRKSPYPKTYDTSYEKLLVSRMTELIHDTHAPVMEFLDKKKLDVFLKSPSDYGKPWYGQLMAGPQMLAYMLQVNDWLTKYRVEII